MHCLNSDLYLKISCMVIVCGMSFKISSPCASPADIDECKFDVNNNCTMKCENLISTYNCSCPAGFKLNSDQRTCDGECSSGWSLAYYYLQILIIFIIDDILEFELHIHFIEKFRGTTLIVTVAINWVKKSICCESKTKKV